VGGDRGEGGKGVGGGGFGTQPPGRLKKIWVGGVGRVGPGEALVVALSCGGDRATKPARAGS